MSSWLPSWNTFFCFWCTIFWFISLGALRRLLCRFFPNSNAEAPWGLLFPLLDLQDCYSKSGFLNSSISVSEELDANAESQASHQDKWIGIYFNILRQLTHTKIEEHSVSHMTSNSSHRLTPQMLISCSLPQLVIYSTPWWIPLEIWKASEP